MGGRMDLSLPKSRTLRCVYSWPVDFCVVAVVGEAPGRRTTSDEAASSHWLSAETRTGASRRTTTTPRVTFATFAE